MKKYILPLLGYLAIFLFAFCLIYYLDICITFDNMKPISNVTYDVEKGGYSVTLDSVYNQSLVISDANWFDVLQDKSVIYSASSDDHFRKRVIVHLINSETPTEIIILGSELQAPVSMRKINIYIMNTAIAESIDLTITNWNHLFAGILVAVFIWSLSLFFFKSSEVYLLHIAISAVLNFINLATPLNLLGISTSYTFNMQVRPLLLVICCGHFGFTLMYLFYDFCPRRLSKLRNIQIILIFATACIFQLLIGDFIYPTFRLLMAGAVALVLINAIRAKATGALPLFLASAVAEGVIFYVYILNRSSYSAGNITAFWRTTEIAQIALLMIALLVVNYRFASRFVMSEKLSAELLDVNAHLEEKVAERTEELHRQQEQKIAMMQNIFHDLRSPIFILQSRLKDMEAEGLPVTESKKRLDYLSGLVSDLFQLSKLEAGKVIFDEDDVDIDTLVSDEVASFCDYADEMGLLLSCNCSSAATVWGDSLQLRQTVHNLLQNAFQHTQSGGISVSTQLDNTNVLIKVSDTGEGIPAEECDMVFNRYYTSRYSRKENSSGLGLTIAKEITEAHQGVISVHSVLGQGTTFVVSLPVLN